MTCLRRVPYLVWLVLLFLGSRLLFLMLLHPDQFFLDPEVERYHGTIAQELVHGLHGPFLDYRANTHTGGSLVVGAIASVFFRLLGPTVLALKLTPLLFFTVALVFWVFTLRRHASDRVALYFALLFIFSPSLFTSYSLAALGGTTESICFTAMTLFFLSTILSDPHCPRSYPMLLGITAGFGLWFSYIYGLTLLALLLFWLRHDDSPSLKTRLAFFGPSFLLGFSPWILINLQNDWSGLLIHGRNLWDHFSLTSALTMLSDFRSWFPYQLFAAFASNESSDFLRRALNLSYAVLFLVPILTAGFVVLKAPRTKPTGAKPDHVNLTHFALLYLSLFALAVQFSDFKEPRYNVAAYPFMFLLLASSVARLEATFPFARERIRTAFLSAVIVLSIAGSSSLVSLEQAGIVFTAKGYSYGTVPEIYFCQDDLKACDDQVLRQIDQSPFVSTMLSTLTPEDQREFWIATIPMLAAGVSGHSLKGEVPRIEGLIPCAFLKHFFYWLGVSVISSNPNDLPKAVSSVDFLRFRSAAWHQLTLTGIYAAWPEVAPLVASPESLLGAPVRVAPEIAPPYWTGLGQYAGRYWYKTDFSLEHLHAQLDKVLPRLDPSTQRYVLQGIGRFLFRKWTGYAIIPPALVPSQLERLPRAYHQGLFEGAGMALAEIALHSWSPSLNETSSLWRKATAGLSDASISSIRQGWKQFMDRLGDQAFSGVVGARCNAEAGEQPTRNARER